MRPEEISERLKQKPFTPFRLRLETGAAREISDPKLLFVFPNRLLLVSPESAQLQPGTDRYETLPLAMIQALEDTGEAATISMVPPSSTPTPAAVSSMPEAAGTLPKTAPMPAALAGVKAPPPALARPTPSPAVSPAESFLLGYVAPDTPTESNERIRVRTTYDLRSRFLRNQFVTITDAVNPQTMFLGRILEGPYLPTQVGEGDIIAEVEIQGELLGHLTQDTNNRPSPGSSVHELPAEAVRVMLGLSGDMVMGCLTGREDLQLKLESKSKDVLPRNVGIFGTVGSGKSNSVQVLIEEAANAGWAVILLDLEAEYIDMDKPMTQTYLVERLKRFGRQPQGLEDFHVYHPISCASDRKDSQPFTLRIADFDSSVTAELMQATVPERNALLDCIDHLQQKFRTQMPTKDEERLSEILDATPQAKLPYTLQHLRNRAQERAPRNSDTLDYVGVASKLQMLMHSGVFDQPNIKGLDPGEMLFAGRVNVIDVSISNDTVKNLVTADLLRKAFAHKVVHADAPPTMLVIEEAHSFMSRERVHTMQATLQMLRNVTRRGRKRWLAVAFVSQQPGHLPPEIFELCNTRIVHTLRSMHNLDTLMATTGDVTRELWARCPLLGTGEAIISSPQFRRSVVAAIRPAMSSRRFVK